MLQDDPPPLSPHCYFCGRDDCLEGRYLTMFCPKYKLSVYFKSKGWKKGDACCGGKGLASGCPVCEKIWE